MCVCICIYKYKEGNDKERKYILWLSYKYHLDAFLLERHSPNSQALDMNGHKSNSQTINTVVMNRFF